MKKARSVRLVRWIVFMRFPAIAIMVALLGCCLLRPWTH
jgi:hypothetical protein